jgi:hypothetical protein
MFTRDRRHQVVFGEHGVPIGLVEMPTNRLEDALSRADGILVAVDANHPGLRGHAPIGFAVGDALRMERLASPARNDRQRENPDARGSRGGGSCSQGRYELTS